MATEIVTGLSGIEIIKDILLQIESKLKRDCYLRDSDSYTRGFSAKIEVHVEAYGLDASVVDATISIGTPQDDPEMEVVHETIEIPQEENLTLVRERIEESEQRETGTLAIDESGTPIRQKRKYNKRLPMAGGGAEDIE